MEAHEVEKLAAAIREFAELFPDVVYDNSTSIEEIGILCTYSPDEERNNIFGCIVGAGLTKIGRQDLIAELGTYEEIESGRRETGVRTTPTADRLLLTAMGQDPYEYPGSAIQWITRVQQHQDSGGPWGRAVQLADLGNLGYAEQLG